MTYVHYISLLVLGVWLIIELLIVFEHEKLERWLEALFSSKKLNDNAIQEAVEVMTDGVLFADLDGRTLLVNSAMLSLMEKIFLKQYRNAKLFNKDLWEFKDNDLVQTKRVDDQLFLHFKAGGWYQFSRKKLLSERGGAVWQYLLADVTEKMELTQQLEERNNELAKKNKEAKQVLLDLEIVQKQKTIDTVMHKIHDLLGSRISILQQVLNNQELQRYDYIASLVHNVMSDLRKDLINPEDNLRELTETYKSIGIELDVIGQLPKEQKQAEIMVTILRDALSNAVRHGKAGRIKIHLGYSMLVEDDGVGCSELHMGTGLKGMQELLEKNGGKLTINTGEHFSLRADL